MARGELEATGAHSAGAAAATIEVVLVLVVTVTIWGHRRAAAEGNADEDRGNNMMQARYWVIQAR